MIGKVTVWVMSEEERLAYIEKHPIIPTEKPKGANFSNVNTMQMDKNKERKKQPSIMDKVDKDDIQRRFVAGEKVMEIAEAVGVNRHTLGEYINEQRRIEPDKWPHRIKGGGNKMGQVIQSFEVAVDAAIYTFEVGKEFGGEVVADIIERDGVFMLFNRHDQRITEIKNFPVVSVKFEYPLSEVKTNAN